MVIASQKIIEIRIVDYLPETVWQRTYRYVRGKYLKVKWYYLTGAFLWKH